MKLAKRMIQILLLSIVGVVILYFALALVLSYLSFAPKPTNGPKIHQLHLSTNGVHVDLILPLTLVEPDLATQIGIQPGTQYVAFGWGDKGFYLETPTWAELKASVAIRAMFMPSSTAMHVTNYFSRSQNWATVAISQEQLDAIREHIKTSFSYDKASGRVIELEEKGYTDQDRFYEAEGRYTGLYTCNIWVNQGLKKAHIRTSVWSPFEFGIMHHMQKLQMAGQ